MEKRKLTHQMQCEIFALRHSGRRWKARELAVLYGVSKGTVLCLIQPNGDRYKIPRREFERLGREQFILKYLRLEGAQCSGY